MNFDRESHGPTDPARAQRQTGGLIAGRYAVERELGRGGMATVYLARDLKHGRPVALKFLDAVNASTTAVERFMREIAIVAQLSHPHILALHDSGEADGSLYFVMPYIPGESLRARIDREGRQPIDDVVRMAREVCDALAHAHAHGVIHRDIKPENLLLADGHTFVADFGIARAHLLGSFGRLTDAGTVIGTPAYMSPEQACGDPGDERSDIYSLACVLYEALLGEPPGGSGGRGQRALAERLLGPPTSLRDRRQEIPPPLERALRRALQPSPGDRFESATDFAKAILELTPHRERGRWVLGTGAVTVVVLAVGVAWAFLRTPHPAMALDTSRYAVFPFQHPTGAGPALLAGDNCQRLFTDALARWQGVTPVNDLLLHEALIGRDTTLRTALSLAAAQRAGRLVWGSVTTDGNRPGDILVQATIYDVRTREPHARATVRVATDLSNASEQFTALADSLVSGVASAGGRTNAFSGRRSVPALEAYVSGYRALGEWDLRGALEQFRAATRADPDFALAQLWLAQTAAWISPSLEPEWTNAAKRSYTLRDQLGSRDHALAVGLAALADGNYPQACAQYRGLVHADSLDFIAWYGLGECQSRDRRVVRDRMSPSGWRFRSSMHASILAYSHALELIPSFQQAFIELGSARLADLLFTGWSDYRSGYALGQTGDTVLLAALPGLVRDTLSFVPYTFADLRDGQPWTMPASYAAAVARNRRLLGSLTARWARAMPGSTTAHLQLARVLESMGQLESQAADDTTALSEIRRVRNSPVSIGDSIVAGVAEIRLDVKRMHFAAARVLSDSLLGRWTHRAAGEARLLAPLAALTGHVHRAAAELRQTAPFDTIDIESGTVVPPAVPAAEALAFRAYAAMGAPVDSMRVVEPRAERLIRGWIAPRDRQAVLYELLDWPAVLAFPVIGLQSVHRSHANGDVVLEMQWALAQHDSVAVRRGLADPRLRPQPWAGRPEPDVLLGLVDLWLAVGDTAAATQALDDMLSSLSRYDTFLLDDVRLSACLVRDMAVRAELAARSGDNVTARRWGQAVVDLWGSADPEFRSTVTRARALAATPDS